jgi:hypothetical protein
MTGRKDRLAALRQVAALLSDQALAPVAAAQAQVEAARGHAAAIARTRAELSANAADPVQAALMARQAQRLRQRQAAAMTDLARLQANLEMAKAAARPAFGRKIALDRLLTERSRKP